MALDRINLYPRETSKRSLKVNLGTALIGASTFLLIVAVVLTVIKTTSVNQKAKELARLEASAADLKQRLVAFEKESHSNEFKKSAFISSFMTKKTSWSGLLKELSLLSPQDLWLTSLTGEAKDGEIKLLMTGEAVSQALVSDFSSTLESSFFFRNVKLKFSEQLEDVDPAIYRFQVECQVGKFVFGSGQ